MARSYKSLREAMEMPHHSVERPFNCPAHEDSMASATVNVDKGVWFCHACFASGKTESGTHDLKYVRLLQDEPIPALPPLFIMYTNAYLGYGSYWATRYGTDVARLFQTGVDPVSGMPTIPIHDALGTTVHGFLMRKLDTQEGPKYLYPKGVPISRLLFGHHLVHANPEVLVLVEGASDLMSLHQWHLPRGAAVVAVYGAGLHATQAELVKALTPHRVVVAMDADGPGQLANTRSVERMGSLGVEAVVYDWSLLGVSDPGELKEDPWPSLMLAK